MDLGGPEKRNHVILQKLIIASAMPDTWVRVITSFNTNWGMNQLTAPLQRRTQEYWQMKSYT